MQYNSAVIVIPRHLTLNQYPEHGLLFLQGLPMWYESSYPFDYGGYSLPDGVSNSGSSKRDGSTSRPVQAQQIPTGTDPHS